MPVPISAQVYMPNPALGPQSYARGAEVGQSTSPFASFVQGAFKGAQATANIMDTLQQIEYRPQEMEIQQRAADRADKAETRQQGTEEFNQKYDTQRLQLEQEKFNFEKSQETEKLLIQKNNAAVARSNQNSKTEAEGVIAQAIGQGDFSGIMAIQNNPSKQDVLYHVMDKLAEPNGYGPAFSKSVQNYVTSGQARPEEAMALQRFGENVGYASSLKNANKNRPSDKLWINTMGVVPDPHYDILAEDVKNADGLTIGKDVFQLVPGEGKHKVGRYLSNGDPHKDQPFENAMSAHQAAVDAERRVREKILAGSVRQSAALQESSRQPAPEDTPAKLSREQSKSGYTPEKRVGPSVATVTDLTPAVDDVNRRLAQQRAAKPNSTMNKAKDQLQKTANPNRPRKPDIGDAIASSLIYGR